MKHVLLLAVITLSANFSCGQSSISEPETATNSSDPVIEFVSKNVMGESVAVHTYKITSGTISNTSQTITDSDAVVSRVNFSTAEIQKEISAHPNVNECSFDKATGTYTILTKPEIDLKSFVAKINQK
jgi:3-phenylpropionate/cinnamic acid dioxygenase small subunit